MALNLNLLLADSHAVDKKFVLGASSLKLLESNLVDILSDDEALIVKPVRVN